MSEPISLTDYIKARHEHDDDCGISDGHCVVIGQVIRVMPRWIERMQQGQTKAKDLTGYVNGAWTRGSDGGAA